MKAKKNVGSGRRTACCRIAAIVVAAVGVCLLRPAPAAGNGGPFVVKYPGGDPAAKGVLARLDPGLMPGREERLKVVTEDLAMTLEAGMDGRAALDGNPPLVNVTAAYRIVNPTREDIEMDFGFPILRGVYVNPLSMLPRPDVRVTVDGRHADVRIISNSAIYGAIRRRAREVIDTALAGDERLTGHVKAVADAGDGESAKAHRELKGYLTGTLNWTERDAALMLEYAVIDLGQPPSVRPPFPWYWQRDKGLNELALENLGMLSAIGEQKATQFLAHLAGLLQPREGTGYEDVFTAWGGDIRERSIDMTSGEIRPREVVLSDEEKGKLSHAVLGSDPTIYARVDYLDENAKLTDEEKESCKAVLKNLPVIFTFAPMNLLYYRVSFPAGSERTVTVSYSQYAYADTRDAKSYQIAYVVHPASLWGEFGPINLKIKAPDEAKVAASVPLAVGDTHDRNIARQTVRYATYTGTVEDKSGELFVAVGAESWHNAFIKRPSNEAVQTARR